MDMHDVDLAEAVRSVSQAIWPLMVKDGRNFEVIGIENPAMVRGNFDSICRAIRNLLENALKYTPKASPITVSLNNTTVKISDKGTGVAPADKEKIFGKFSRPDRQRGQGAGLGLFIVSRIMQIHGGSVSVDNAPDGGAVFTLSFPIPGKPQDSAA
jgi:signal transduction histidine kinase